MSVYSTKTIKREEAIAELLTVWKHPAMLTNSELEEEMFNHFGREGLERSRLENYDVID